LLIILRVIYRSIFYKYFNLAKLLPFIAKVMIRIPFPQCVILTTLDFAQITHRLESAIDAGEAQSPSARSISHPRLSFADSAADRSRIESHALVKIAPKNQHFVGEIQGFKFLATRIIGHKYLHLPKFLVPTVEGKINSLYHGYQISLCIKVHQITFILLLAWLGGLITAIASVVSNILAGIGNDRFLVPIEFIALVYVALLAYLYIDTSTMVVRQPAWSADLQVQDTNGGKAATDWLRKNLPSLTSQIGKIP
jgi:hypothetical protein